MIMLSLMLLSVPSSSRADTALANLSGVGVDSVSQEPVLNPELAMGWEQVEAGAHPLPAAPIRPPAWVVVPPPDLDPPVDTTRARPKAVEYSDFYYTRLAIHKYASYATIPLFVAEGIVGQKLYNTSGESSLRGTHSALAAGIGILFGVNTVTGMWNLWDGRKNPAGRTRRMVHSLLMLVSDAGFVATASSAPHRESEGGGPVTNEGGSPSTHRTLAITSGSVAMAGYLMMLFWKD
jgi:hypothetical protein